MSRVLTKGAKKFLNIPDVMADLPYFNRVLKNGLGT
jgi:hypothetical protein